MASAADTLGKKAFRRKNDSVASTITVGSGTGSTGGSGDVSSHEGAADPHAQYLLDTVYNAHNADEEAHQMKVTLSTEVDTLFALTDQDIDFDTINANYGLFGPTSGGAAKPTVRAMVEADLAAHDIVGTKHTVTGSALDVVGLSGTNTLAVLTPSSAPGVAESLLKTDSNGYIGVERIGLNLGSGVAPTYPIHIKDTTNPQIRIEYDASNYSNLYVDGSGNLQITNDPGDVVFRPITGKDVRPFFNYDTNLGTSSNRWLALYAAELWVQTLVAQDVLSTIGGRILVGPTTELIADVGTGATTIDVKHNQIASGDIVYLQTAPGGIAQIEAMVTTSGPTTITGGYRYSVTRNFDTSGTNSWVAGDAVFNTGQIGDGFIDIFAEQGVHGSGAGPTIIGNVRTGVSAFGADISPRWAIGNLNGTYNVGSDTYGIGFGDADGSYLVADATNGIRIENPTGRSFWVKSTGEMRLGGNVSDPASLALVAVPVATSFNGETLGANDVLFGDNSFGKPNFLFDKSASRISVRDGKIERVYIDTDGFHAAGAVLNDDGVSFSTGASFGVGNSIKYVDASNNVLSNIYQLYIADTTRRLRIEADTGVDTAAATFIEIEATGLSSSSAGASLTAIAGGGTNRAQVIANSGTSGASVTLGGRGTFNGVLIDPDTLSLDSPSTMLDINTTTVGEGIKIGDSFMGVGGFGSGELFLSHWDFKGSSTQHTLRANSSGDTLINITTGRTGHLTEANVSKVTWTGSQLRVRSGVSFKFEDDMIANRGGTDFTATFAVQKNPKVVVWNAVNQGDTESTATEITAGAMNTSTSAKMVLVTVKLIRTGDTSVPDDEFSISLNSGNNTNDDHKVYATSHSRYDEETLIVNCDSSGSIWWRAVVKADVPLGDSFSMTKTLHVHAFWV